jgi:hypothetical protein
VRWSPAYNQHDYRSRPLSATCPYHASATTYTAQYRLGTLTVAPTADAYVRADNAGSNFGTASSLASDGSPIKESYLRFDTGPFSGSVTAATLRLCVTDGSSTASGTISTIADTSWTETGITYTNRPTAAGTPVGSFSSATVTSTAWPKS